MSKPKNVITIQHPESIHHTNGMIGSWTDWELSEKGLLQAENIAQNLKTAFTTVHFSIYASSLTRTEQTARLVANKWDGDYQLIDALRERNLGKAVGKSVQWLRDNIESEEHTIYDRCFHDAESKFDVWQRLLPFFTDILHNEEENIIIISHGEALSLFHVMWLGLPVESLDSLDLHGVSGGISFLQQAKSGKRVIKRLSDTSFMQ
ncbi:MULTISPECIES: histidine phosphatase family protein [Sphingobacterium]|uniref:Histidine phosphatase family protein n=1 Tax=Sphingobacterium populi TaxID=1812824 RepID=A0ABW5UDJ8_9SPHI|nr:histidine phosphatase family protein [Sphingobacterium sp. CFCC 11742]